MTRLSVVIFPHPVAKAPTHQREQHFSAETGWTIERDDVGDFHLVGHGLDFWTDGAASWVPAPPVRDVLRAMYLESKQETEAASTAAVDALKSVGIDVTVSKAQAKRMGKRRG